MAKKKDQEKADKAERERARQETQMAKAMKRARDTEAKKSSAKASAPGDAAVNGQEPPPKRCEPHESCENVPDVCSTSQASGVAADLDVT